MADKAGVELWLHTIFVDSLMTDNRISGVRVHNKSGFHDLWGSVIIDATGDADVSVRAGVEYVQDIPTAALNATLLFRVGGVDAEMFMADIQRDCRKR